MSEQDKNEEVSAIDFDGRWKEIIEALFEEFILFFLPELHHQIDFSYPAKFLKQDLPKLAAKETKKGDMINDNLIEVRLKSGQTKFLYIHIEVHGYENIDFGRKMFRYFYRIFDKFEKEITALAILINSRLPKNYDRFYYKFGQTEISYKFPVYIVREQQKSALLASDNPFAIAVLTCLEVDRTRKDAEERLNLKFEIFNLILKRGWDKNYSTKVIVNLMKFIINVILLPKEMNTYFLEHSFQIIEKKQAMVKASELDIQLADRLTSVLFGTTFSELKYKFEQETEKRKKEAAKRKAAEAKRKKEEAKRKEEEAKRLADRTKTILLLHQSFQQTAEQIAKSLEYDLQFVQQVINENAKP